MRQQARIGARSLVLVGAALALAIVLVLIVGRIGGRDEAATVQALERIEAKNRKAAIKAAAIQREQSRAQAEAADREADLRDADNEAAPLTRFETANGVQRP